MNTRLLASNMNLPPNTEDWKVPVSEIRDRTHTLIDLFGIGNVRAFRHSAMGYERDAMIIAYKGEILIKHVAVTERVTAWRSQIPVARSHAQPVHPCLLAVLDDTPYIPANTLDDVLTLDVCGYEQRLQVISQEEDRRHDKEASKEHNVHWHQMRQNLQHKPKNWADFLCRKGDEEAQHHRTSHDRLTNTIYTNTAPVGPSGLTTIMPNQSYPPPQPVHWHQAYEAVSPTSQRAMSAFAAGSSGGFGPPS
ncbi:hypothetical protein IW261DRAFT_1013936 [Armillaria novae-zelandiae]|uniref:Uncharacterized protein n=1 Tax=Armillaria novae-zelandiae TaxID=153914 RepID=A0AA39NNF8_9AGAR|nr:hypothetical protein IW261DRAFT_1013936 [Armillaria novae-zelandiae]